MTTHEIALATFILGPTVIAHQANGNSDIPTWALLLLVAGAVICLGTAYALHFFGWLSNDRDDRGQR